MSYEGYEQHICANGHRFDMPCGYQYWEAEEAPKCGCGAKSVWYNPVDQTNGDDWGYIPPALFRHESHGRIAVPSTAEEKEMRTYGSEHGWQMCESNGMYIAPEYRRCNILEIVSPICDGKHGELVMAQLPMSNPCC